MEQHDMATYRALGYRDAIAELCAMIRHLGIVDGCTHMILELREMEPDNPHIKPAVQLLQDQAIHDLKHTGDTDEPS